MVYKIFFGKISVKAELDSSEVHRAREIFHNFLGLGEVTQVVRIA
jgi:hypothetical protein